MTNITTLVIHDHGVCATWRWSKPWWEVPHCPTCTCHRVTHDPPHGQWVTCGQCGQTGIVPDPGHESDFLP